MGRANELRQEILGLVRHYSREKFTKKSFDPQHSLLHYAGRIFDEQELVNLVDASLDFYLTANRYAEQFEAEFADFFNLSNALLVNSGSSANLIALSSLTSPQLGKRALKPGDEVITVPFTFIASVNPILMLGATPIFVDISEKNYN